MAKKQKNFDFLFPLTYTVVEDCRQVIKHVGDFHVFGVGYFYDNASVVDVNERYDVDLDFITWNGTDIKEVLEITADSTLADIHEAALQHVASLFDQTIKAA